MSTATPIVEQSDLTGLSMDQIEPFRIAIVGGGPRGLHCLVELNERLQRTKPPDGIALTIFEPCEFAGAGTVYDPRQPRYLKMNFAAKHISAWRRNAGSVDQQRSLVGWLSSNGHSGDLNDAFVPRCDVGKYLHSCFQDVVARLRTKIEVKVVRQKVTAIDPDVFSNRGWQLLTAGEVLTFDEVVITVGHEGWRQSPKTDGRRHLNMLPPFPVDAELNEDNIPAGTNVAVQGFGLTFIDTALALTEGRGGIFTEHRDGWRYEASGSEPHKIMPFSRSGRPMLAKPDEDRFPEPSSFNDIWEHGMQQIGRLLKPIDEKHLIDGLWKSVTSAAAVAANRVDCWKSVPEGDIEWGGDTVKEWFQQMISGVASPKVTQERMRRSWLVGTGQVKPGIEWALAAAWRNMYPALVSSMSHGGMVANAWPTFRLLSSEMERIAFGPPSENMGKILALIDSGLIDLGFVAGRIVAPSSEMDFQQVWLTNGRDGIAVDHCIDAVNPSPLQHCPQGPLQGLLRGGVIHRLHGTEGIHINEFGRPLSPSGQIVDGLSILGRATEGCVLGNDSLSRSLNDHPRQWAGDVVNNMKRAD